MAVEVKTVYLGVGIHIDWEVVEGSLLDTKKIYILIWMVVSGPRYYKNSSSYRL